MNVHLNRPLVLQTPTRMADGAGGFVLAWVSEGVLGGGVGAGSAGLVALVAVLDQRRLADDDVPVPDVLPPRTHTLYIH